jgi:hypothetical protein
MIPADKDRQDEILSLGLAAPQLDLASQHACQLADWVRAADAVARIGTDGAAVAAEINAQSASLGSARNR